MLNIVYRKAQIKDLDKIEILIKSAIYEMESHNIMQWDDLYPVKEDFEQDIKKEHLYVGCIDNEIAVVFALNQEFDDAYKDGNWKALDKSFFVVHRLCVNPKYQKKGIAINTMQFIEKILMNEGVEAIRLDVYSENPYALKLYNKCGFINVGKAEWRKGTFYLMEKILI